MISSNIIRGGARAGDGMHETAMVKNSDGEIIVAPTVMAECARKIEGCTDSRHQRAERMTNFKSHDEKHGRADSDGGVKTCVRGNEAGVSKAEEERTDTHQCQSTHLNRVCKIKTYGEKEGEQGARGRTTYERKEGVGSKIQEYHTHNKRRR